MVDLEAEEPLVMMKEREHLDKEMTEAVQQE